MSLNFCFWSLVKLILLLMLLPYVSLCWAGKWQDDFRNKGASEKAWTPQKPPWVISQTWEVKNRVYVAQVLGGDQSYSVTGEQSWDDYSIEAKVRYPKKGDPPFHFGVGVRYQDLSNYYDFGFLLFPIGSPTRITVWARANGIVDRPFIKPFQIEPDTWYTLKMEAKGKLFECFVNGKSVGQFEHEGVKSGKAALWGGPGDFEFDDVTISGPKIPNRLLAIQPQGKLAMKWGFLKVKR